MAQTNKSIMFTTDQYAVIAELRDKLSKDMNMNLNLGEAAMIVAKDALKQLTNEAGVNQ